MVDAGLIVLVTVCALFAAISCLLTFRLVRVHVKNYSQPEHQRYIIRILMMVPLYAVYSLMCIIFIDVQVYLSILRDTYEAYAIYCFFRLCISFAGGTSSLVSKLSGQEVQKLPIPLCCCACRTDSAWLTVIQRCILQYVIVRPLTSVVAIVLEATGHYEDGVFDRSGGYLYVQIINNIAFSISLYCLVVFYMVTKSELKAYRPLLKFISIKIVVFFSFWQSIAMAILNALICMEMMFVSFMHMKAYPADAYIVGAMSKAPLVHAVEMSGSVLHSVRDTLSQSDMVADTRQAFGRIRVRNAVADPVLMGHQDYVAGEVPGRGRGDDDGDASLEVEVEDDDPHANLHDLADDDAVFTSPVRR